MINEIYCRKYLKRTPQPSHEFRGSIPFLFSGGYLSRDARMDVHQPGHDRVSLANIRPNACLGRFAETYGRAISNGCW